MTAVSSGSNPGIDAPTQPDPASPVAPAIHQSDTARANSIRQTYRPPHQLNSPDATHAGSAALLAAQHTTSPTAWTFEGNAGASAAATLAGAHSKPIEAWKPDKLSSAGAAASLAHRTSISEHKAAKDAKDSANTALYRPRSGSEAHEPAALAVSSAEASLTNSTIHAMKAASMAHKPSLSLPHPEKPHTTPTHALRAASTADRESTVQKPQSPTYYRTSEESARVQALATELARRSIASASASGGVGRADLTRAATLSMQRKTATDQAETAAADAKRKVVVEEAMNEWTHQSDLDDAARRIVAERIARVTLTGEEGDEVLAGKAAGASIVRGQERVKDWERVLRELDSEDKADKERNTGWLRQSMRRTHPMEPTRNDPAAIMAAAERNVRTRMDAQDKEIAQEQLILGKPTGENAARRDAYTKELETKGHAELAEVQKKRASTYDIGGMIMTHEQVEAIAQKHVNEVLQEINEKVKREKERIEAEAAERERIRAEKASEKAQKAAEKAAEKAEKDRIKAAVKEAKAEQKREKMEATVAEKKRKEEEKTAQNELKNVTREQAGVPEGLAEYDAVKDKEAAVKAEKEEKEKEEKEKEGMLNEVQGEQAAVVSGLLEFDKEKEEEHTARKEMLAEVEGEQPRPVEGVMAFDQQKEDEQHEKEAVEHAKMEDLLHQTEAEQAAAATGLEEDDKSHEIVENRINYEEPLASAQAEARGSHGLRNWFKEKIGRRTSRNAQDLPPAPTTTTTAAVAEGTTDTRPTTGTSKHTEEEDIYGAQPIIASNWTEANKPRDDSLRNVALATHSDTQPSRLHEGGVSAGEDEVFEDAKEDVENLADPTAPFLSAENEGRSSGERGSRFKEEF